MNKNNYQNTHKTPYQTQCKTSHPKAISNTIYINSLKHNKKQYQQLYQIPYKHTMSRSILTHINTFKKPDQTPYQKPH